MSIFNNKKLLDEARRSVGVGLVTGVGVVAKALASSDWARRNREANAERQRRREIDARLARPEPRPAMSMRMELAPVTVTTVRQEQQLVTCCTAGAPLPYDWADDTLDRTVSVEDACEMVDDLFPWR